MSTKSATMASQPEELGAKSGVSEADVPEEGVDVDITADDSTDAVITGTRTAAPARGPLARRATTACGTGVRSRGLTPPPSPTHGPIDCAEGGVASKPSFKSVGFPEEDEEEEPEELDADAGFLTKVYVGVFDALFNALLFVLSSAAALLHMLSRPISSISDPNLSIMRWPEMLPVSRIATKRLASFIGMSSETKEE